MNYAFLEMQAGEGWWSFLGFNFLLLNGSGSKLPEEIKHREALSCAKVKKTQ